MGAGEIAFAARGKAPLRWPLGQIQTIDISAHEVVVRTYENRGHHQPGDRRYRFELQSELPPQVAEEVARRLDKPSRNAVPEAGAPDFATIPAKHQKPFGGSNGELRFRAAGIDFVTNIAREARAWRWADIQTLANPDPYHFRVSGYREVYEFELKQSMSRQLFDRLWDSVYARDLNLPNREEEGVHDRQR